MASQVLIVYLFILESCLLIHNREALFNDLYLRRVLYLLILETHCLFIYTRVEIYPRHIICLFIPESHFSLIYTWHIICVFIPESHCSLIYTWHVVCLFISEFVFKLLISEMRGLHIYVRVAFFFTYLHQSCCLLPYIQVVVIPG